MENKYNKNAIFSLVFSLVSFIIFGWLSACGVGLGIAALKEIKKTNEKGKVLAILGIIIGLVALVLYIIGMMMR